jgi:hypothetical protein
MKLILFVLLIFFGVSCMYQPRMYNSKIKSTWPQRVLGTPLVGNGIIYFKNDSSVIGLILIMQYRYDVDSLSNSLYPPVQILPVGKTKIEDIQTVYLYDISCIKIQNHAGSDSIEFKPFDSSLAKLVGKKNNIRIYRRHVYKSEWSIIDNDNFIYDWIDIFIISKDKILAFFRINDNSIENQRAGYMTFINQKYGQHFSKKDLKAKGEKWVINFILEKEDERLINEPKQKPENFQFPSWRNQQVR